MLLAETRIILPSRISPNPRNQDEYKTCCGRRETHQEALDTSPTGGAVRQKPGRVIVRHFRDWLLWCKVCRPSLATSQSPRVSGMRINKNATARQIESAQSQPSSCLGQLEADLRSLTSGKVCSIEIRRDDRKESCSMHESQLRHARHSEPRLGRRAEDEARAGKWKRGV
jgi:hypothetical protein